MAKYDHGGGCPCGLYKECLDDCENQSFIRSDRLENQSFIRSDRLEKDEPYYKYVIVGEIVSIENSTKTTSLYSETYCVITVQDYYTNITKAFCAPCEAPEILRIGMAVLIHIEGNEISWYTLANMDFTSIWKIED